MSSKPQLRSLAKRCNFCIALKQSRKKIDSNCFVGSEKKHIDFIFNNLISNFVT